jgi:septal ring factor EnvC (AmiA/AmiB activator)
MNDTPTPTPRLDERKTSFALDTIRQLERELTAAREELADFKRHIDVQNKLINTLQSKKVKFKKQRDRLAEVVNRLLPFVDPIIGGVRHAEARDALQSLNQPTEP